MIFFRLVFYIIITILITGCKQNELYLDNEKKIESVEQEKQNDQLTISNYEIEYLGKDPSIVFIGDDRIDYMQFDKYLDNHCYNYGKQGVTSKYIVDNIMINIKDISTDYYVISIGLNDDDIEQTIYNLNDIVDYISMEVGKNYIYITNIINTRKKIYDNDKIKEMCINNNINYIEINQLYNLNGYLDEEFSIDNVNLNEKGKIVFMENIKNSLGL